MPAPHIPNRLQRLNHLRILWPFMRRHLALFSGWLIALAVSSAATLTLPSAFKQMIDHGFSSEGQINRTFALLLLVAVILAVGTAARLFSVSLLGEKIITDLRSQLYAHLIGLDASFHDRNRSNELVSRLATDSELLRSIIGSTMSVATRSTVTAIGSLIMLFITSPRLASLSLVVIPLVILPIVLGAQQLQKAARTSQDRIADTNSFAAETLRALRTVQAYAREHYERTRFDRTLETSLQAARQRIHIQTWVTAASIVLIFSAIVGVLWAGAHDVIAGRMSAGTLGEFVLYALIGGGSIGALAEVWNELQRAAGGMGRIFELLKEKNTLTVPATPALPPHPLRGEIRFERVGFHYPQRPETPALDDIDLHIRPGETIAFVGPSGAGKSTLISLLLRFYDPTHGRILIDGVDLRQTDPKVLRTHIALVQQQPTLFTASAMENIRYGRLDATTAEIEIAARSSEADGFIRALPQGYATELGEHGLSLSDGQQQRIAIARALLKEAPILLLDEATNALDAQNEQAVQQALERLMTGRTTLIIAHRLVTILKADRIVVMDQGRIVAQGTHSELIAAGGLYAKLARLQFIE
ncbi:ABC transporter ATP-binding protein/permease [Xylella fastidiosa subsp. multiplex]|uniref:ABC transporter ATP-binding protein/permease n=1 Tax=Xylella fastidiosa subsp. multiplex TaxID=644357 RepID=A0AAW6HS30_XYLFS|nr:ABC transporter ATP-binding protein/permease [Xylella fastidiosa]MCH7233752.1 ABC transporter ATP-binding protein/permease [Xylella fastidiosa subsp. multiplex]MDC6407631.1 ABC transporter ATP-binding protein/permease [Xylella fastidiosa subsp. multiplex]MDD0935124.1 ABC transporter ATP-binding protein/permease [Xylella fastidiosa subsp. multiplex]MSS69439.1 ABC transporter ATP-binding protein/permease [Xylella fastidiosa subsp. multiplex]